MNFISGQKLATLNANWWWDWYVFKRRAGLRLA